MDVFCEEVCTVAGIVSVQWTKGWVDEPAV